MPEKKTYGTSRGHVIDDAVIEALATEAEAGYDVTKLRRLAADNAWAPPQPRSSRFASTQTYAQLSNDAQKRPHHDERDHPNRHPQIPRRRLIQDHSHSRSRTARDRVSGAKRFVSLCYPQTCDG